MTPPVHPQYNHHRTCVRLQISDVSDKAAGSDIIPARIAEGHHHGLELRANLVVVVTPPLSVERQYRSVFSASHLSPTMVGS
jgi:hypothetical protein